MNEEKKWMQKNNNAIPLHKQTFLISISVKNLDIHKSKPDSIYAKFQIFTIISMYMLIHIVKEGAC